MSEAKMPTFADQQHAWSHPPVDDVGYISSADLLQKGDSDLVEMIQNMWKARYYGWRNYENRWREVMGLESTVDSTVLDFGCGVGLESLEYARAGNEIFIADIAPTNIELAQRVLQIFGHEAAGTFEIKGRSPYISGLPTGSMKVIHCSGVLHHIPKPTPVVAKMASWLVVGGELRLMLYSDQAWRTATKTDPPHDVESHPEFLTFVHAMDGVGGYADWYDLRRISDRFGEWFKVKRFEYLTQNKHYLGTVLTKL